MLSSEKMLEIPFAEIIKVLWQVISQAIEQFAFLEQVPGRPSAVCWKSPLPAPGPPDYFRPVGMSGDFLRNGTVKKTSFLPRNALFYLKPATAKVIQTFLNSLGFLNVSRWLRKFCHMLPGTHCLCHNCLPSAEVYAKRLSSFILLLNILSD